MTDELFTIHDDLPCVKERRDEFRDEFERPTQNPDHFNIRPERSNFSDEHSKQKQGDRWCRSPCSMMRVQFGYFDRKRDTSTAETMYRSRTCTKQVLESRLGRLLFKIDMASRDDVARFVTVVQAILEHAATHHRLVTRRSLEID